MIVHSEETITLIGGGRLNKKMVTRAMALGPRLVAADGGADAALRYKVTPEAVIGDFDSLSDAAKAVLPENTLHPISEQDSTDFDKCLRNIDAPLVIGVGFSGERLDHQLAAYNTLVRHPGRPCILFGRKELVFLCPPALRLDLDKGTPVSLFPMAAVEGISEGLQWPIKGLNFAPDGRTGTSNISTGPLYLAVTSPKMLVILPEYTLKPLVEALRGGFARWP